MPSVLCTYLLQASPRSRHHDNGRTRQWTKATHGYQHQHQQHKRELPQQMSKLRKGSFRLPRILDHQLTAMRMCPNTSKRVGDDWTHRGGPGRERLCERRAKGSNKHEFGKQSRASGKGFLAGPVGEHRAAWSMLPGGVCPSRIMVLPLGRWRSPNNGEIQNKTVKGNGCD